MKYSTNFERKTKVPTFIEKFRLVFGFLLMMLGLYFGLFTVGVGESLGLLTFIVSPFVMVADK